MRLSGSFYADPAPPPSGFGDFASDLANSFTPLLIPAGTFVQTNADGSTTVYKQPTGNTSNVFSSTNASGSVAATAPGNLLPILLLVGGAFMLLSGRKGH